MSFKIGDRVIVSESYSAAHLIGQKGVVVNVDNMGFTHVEFDSRIPGGHNCVGLARNGHGWIFGRDTSLELHSAKRVFQWNESSELSQFLQDYKIV